MYSTDFEARKAIINKLGGDTVNLTNIFQCELVILALYGGDPSDVNNIFEADKKILTLLGGDATKVNTVFEARKAIIAQLGGSTIGISNNYEASLTHFELAGGEIPDITYYSVVFKNWDGTILYTTNVIEGHTPIYNGNIPTRPSDGLYNYTFNGWTPSLGPVYGNIEYTAYYTATAIPEPEPNIYTIKFINWNGDILQTSQVEEGQTPIYTGETPTRPSDEQYNYTFNGWLPAITEASQDITYTAQYIEEPLVVVPQYLRFGCSNASGTATIKVPSVNLYPDLQYRLVTDNNEGEWGSLQQNIPYSVSNNLYMEFRGNNPTGINTNQLLILFITTGNAFIDGNIMSLCDNGNHDNVLTLNDYAFYLMFGNTSSTGTLDASGLHLPYCNGVYCYGNLFRTNTALTVAPKELAAKQLTKQCYQGMFYNCTNLVTGPEVIAATTIADQSFRIMFSGCSKLKSTPQVEIKALEGTYNCYNMFYNCTTLADVNFTLSSTTLTEFCYRGMFLNCKLISQAPELPATTLVSNCYAFMFNGCTGLTAAPELPATTLAESCYNSMFYNCTSLTQAPELPATTLEDRCYYSMFLNCKLISQAPELPATTLVTWCYYSMFNGCASLSTIKCLATDISTSNALTSWTKNVASSGVFGKAPGVEWPTGTSGIPEGWTTCEMEDTNTLALAFQTDGTLKITKVSSSADFKPNISMSVNSTSDWQTFGGTRSFDTFYNFTKGTVLYFKGNNPDGLNKTNTDYIQFATTGTIAAFGSVMSLIDDGAGTTTTIPNERCFAELFRNTTITRAPKLPATELTRYCYLNMFRNCTSLTVAPHLPAKTLAPNCYQSMFNGCTQLVGVSLPATTLAPACYNQTFSGCTSLTSVSLPAETLVDSCYNQMFLNCSKLSTIICNATDISTSSALNNWTYGVSSTGTFYKASGVTWPTGTSGIPSAWTVFEL